ncbi:hypothetical protein ACWCP8_05400 [Streptomyces sp. NPDC002206]
MAGIVAAGASGRDDPPVWSSVGAVVGSAILRQGVQLGEEAVTVRQLVESPFFPDPTPVEDENPVGHPHIVEAVRDDQGDPARGHLPQRREDLVLAPGVEGYP